MPGLLDGAGDSYDTNFGMTEQERKQPLWSGLIKAGLLGIAAGGDLMPAQRAQMIAQMGGAIGDIGENMQKARSDAAQNMLRSQQIAAGKEKLANTQRFRAYAQSPEMQTALSKLPPAAQFAAKAAIDSGDVDAFQRIITGAPGLELREQTMNLREREFALKQAQADKFKPADVMNTLIN